MDREIQRYLKKTTQFEVWSLSKPEDHGLNPVIGNFERTFIRCKLKKTQK